MPALENPQYEAFAIARARGALLEDAYDEAGYAARNGHAWRVAKRPEVQARIAELRAERSRVEGVFPRTIINVLMHLAQVNDALETPAASKEVRASLADALRLEREIADAKRRDQEILMKSVSYTFRRPPAGRRSHALEPPANRPSTAIEPPSDRPLAALPSPADCPPTAAPAC